MTIRKQYLGFAAVVVALFAGLFLFVSKTYANPSDFTPACVQTGQTSTATNTATGYITLGVGTTTTQCDTYYAGTRITKAEKATVFFQVQATTTAPVIIKARVEYSMDNNDWYAASVPVSSFSTTTAMTGNMSELSFQLASSTFSGDMGGTGVNGGQTSTSTFFQSFTIDTPARYVRVKFYGLNGKAAIWSVIQPWKERTQ